MLNNSSKAKSHFIDKKSAFSLMEISIVVIIIGIIISGITQSSLMVKSSRLQTARSLTQNSPVIDMDNLVVWYETSLENSFIKNEGQDGSSISVWYDNNPQALVKNNAIQATPGSQPKYIANVFNGAIPAIRLDGVDDFLLFNIDDIIGSAYSIFVVEQRRSIGLNLFIGGTSANAGGNLLLGYWNDALIYFSHYEQAISLATSNYTTPKTIIHSFLFSQSLGKQYWLNGGGTPDSYNASFTNSIYQLPGLSIGRAFTSYFNGDIAEVIVFNRALKNSERQLIETYLGKKYNITIS